MSGLVALFLALPASLEQALLTNLLILAVIPSLSHSWQLHWLSSSGLLSLSPRHIGD
jgi:hypothetical protein